MSWSISVIGTPEQVAIQLQQQANNYKDQSKAEFEAALPHMLGIVQQNFGVPGRELKVDAYGSGGERFQEQGTPQPYRECTVIIKEWDPKI